MSTKRLDDLGVLSAYDSNHPEAHPYGSTLKADHLQAREDVKRLATELRECMRTVLIFHGPAGRSIYENDSPEFKRWRALLSEVEAVRQ